MKENLQFTALLDILSRQDLITEYSEDCKDITPSHITINSKDVVPFAKGAYRRGTGFHLARKGSKKMQSGGNHAALRGMKIK